MISAGARRWRRWLTMAGAVTVGLVGIVGFLHTGPGLRLLVRAGVACPAFLVTPAVANELRGLGLAKLRGSDPAPARPALGLHLDASGESDVQTWAGARGLTCTRARRGFVQLSCGKANAQPETTFSFGPAGQLIGVDVFRRLPTAEAALAAFARASDDLRTHLGRPTASVGGPREVLTSPAPFAMTSVSYRFADYLATISAQRMAGAVTVREQYQSARL